MSKSQSITTDESEVTAEEVERVEDRNHPHHESMVNEIHHRTLGWVGNHIDEPNVSHTVIYGRGPGPVDRKVTWDESGENYIVTLQEGRINYKSDFDEYYFKKSDDEPTVVECEEEMKAKRIYYEFCKLV